MGSLSSECDLERDRLQSELNRVNLEIDYIRTKIRKLNNELHCKFVRRQDILDRIKQR